MPKVLITCTQPRADEIVDDLKSESVDAYCLSALIVKSLDIEKPSATFDVMLISSTQVFDTPLPDLPVIAVGHGTGQIATKNGYDVIQTGTGGVMDLDLSGYPNILYPCADVPTCVPHNTIAWPVYETIKNECFDINDEDEIICVFSVKAAQYIRQYDLKNKTILCLSSNVENVFKGMKVADIASCTYPRYDAMKELIHIYLRKHT